MPRTIVRMWTAEGYHKDVAILDEQQVRMHLANCGMESQGRHLVPPFGTRIVVDPKQFPEAVEFEVIVEADRH